MATKPVSELTHLADWLIEKGLLILETDEYMFTWKGASKNDDLWTKGFKTKHGAAKAWLVQSFKN